MPGLGKRPSGSASLISPGLHSVFILRPLSIHEAGELCPDVLPSHLKILLLHLFLNGHAISPRPGLPCPPWVTLLLREERQGLTTQSTVPYLPGRLGTGLPTTFLDPR